MIKQNIPPMIALTIGLLAGVPSLSHAQTTFLPAVDPPSAFNPFLGVPLAVSANPTAPAEEEEAESVTTLLKLDAVRIAQMDRAYSTYARARLTQEAQIANWEEELRTAQAATTFDERKASQLAGSISGAENKIATAYLKARGEALNALTSLQRVQLEKLENENRPVRDDKYRFLLLSQVEDLWRTPIDPETGQALLSASAGAAKSVEQNYYQNYYPVPPVYNSPIYSYGWDSYSYGPTYSYGFQAPFYARPNYQWNGNNYFGSDRRDKNARPRWDRSDRYTRPNGSFGSGTQGSRNPEPQRPSYRPLNPSKNGNNGRGGEENTRPSSPTSARGAPPAGTGDTAVGPAARAATTGIFPQRRHPAPRAQAAGPATAGAATPGTTAVGSPQAGATEAGAPTIRPSQAGAEQQRFRQPLEPWRRRQKPLI